MKTAVYLDMHVRVAPKGLLTFLAFFFYAMQRLVTGSFTETVSFEEVKAFTLTLRAPPPHPTPFQHTH